MYIVTCNMIIQCIQLPACCLITVAGQKLNVEDIIPAEEMFTELLKESSTFVTGGGEPFASVGEFIRTQVLCRTLLFMQQNKK